MTSDETRAGLLMFHRPLCLLHFGEPECDCGFDAALAAHEAALVGEKDAQLAECYRLSGADPDGNEDWRLASFAVQEVRRLRKDYDAAIGITAPPVVTP